HPHPGEKLTPQYWYDNCHQPVAFHPTINNLITDGHHTFIETSAHPVLAPHVGDTDVDVHILTSLRRDDGTAGRFLAGLGRAWILGHHVTPTPHDGPTADLPTYPFQHHTYWISTTAPESAAPADTTEARFWEVVEEGAPDQVAGMLGTRDDATLTDLVPALAAWRRERRTRSRAESWRYRLDWRPVTLPEAALSGTWLAVLPPDGGGEADNAVLAAMERAGARVVRVRARGKRDELAAALREAVKATKATQPAESAESTDESQPVGTLSLLADTESSLVLLQALADARLGGRVWFLTRGAVSTGDSDPIRHPERAELWGLGRVAALEHPDNWGGLIDVPETPSTPDELAALPRILGGQGDEDQVAVRGAGTFACRLVPAPPPARPAAAVFRPHGTVLVTGGTSPTALAVARWLAGNGAERVLLTTASATGFATPAELSGLHADITVAECDPADREALARLLDAIPADAPLTAVVHAGELLDEGPIEGFTPERLRAVLAAKATAARNLHELTKDRDLAAFVLFSSFTGSLGGGVGLGPFAAANAHLDALAAHRRTLGLPATSLGWTAWAHAGRDAEEAEFEESRRERLVQRGLPALDSGLALLAVQEAVERRDTALVVADVEWERFLRRYTATRPSPLLREIPEVARLRRRAAAGGGAAEATDGAGQALVRLAELPEAEREQALLTLVRGEVAAVLGHASGEAVDPRRGLLELGMDSLTTLELRNRLAAATGLRLRPEAVFRNGSPEAVAQHLGTQLPTGAEAVTAPPPGPRSGSSGFAALFHRALDAGTTVEFTDLLGDAARFRPALSGTMPEPVRLAEGSGGPALFCLPTVLATSGPHQFARFAAHFAGERDVWALPLPGYLPGEPLPATLDALLDAAAATIRHNADGAPYALVGYSSGGLLAQATAARLEDAGEGPVAVAAIDTSPLSRRLLVRLMPELLGRLGKLSGADGVDPGLVLDDDRLTAMGGYLRLLTDVTPEPVKARTLLLRAGVDIPGDHFSVIEAHAGTTARSIHDWLDATLGEAHE
ncbi:KR domain-containing protein, partial [Streptomyces sp. NPDC088747]|uniref:KR domain-containing protein n=1 Tax=Streptomyces sp. NPDC088747 TaxID=3365886 RepID=UPI00380A0A75